MAWRVISSDRINQDFRELCGQAENQGRLSAVLNAMNCLYGQLVQDPVAVGEPKFRLKHLDLTVYVAIDRFLVVHYALDEKRQRVYLKHIQLQLGT